MAATDRLEAEAMELIAAVYASHEGLAARAAALVAAATEAGDRRWADIGVLIGAEVENRAGRVPEAVTTARHVLGESDDRIVRAHAHAVISGGLWRIGDNGTAVRHALQANRMLTPGDPPALRADHANILALQMNDQRLGGVSQREFETAQALADESGRPALMIANLNNWAWCTYEAGDLATAATVMRRMRAHSEATGEPLNTSCADTVARILLETGQADEAVRVVEYAIGNAPATDSDAVPGAMMTLAEIRRRAGDFAAALSTLDDCRKLAAERDLPETDAEALRMIASCQAGAGDYAAAYRTMVDFHEAWTVRRSRQSDIAARFAQAQLAVESAWDLAEQDPLTGLGNRRRSDKELMAALASGGPVTVALLDLDHFKRINDTYSHAAGDEVLRQVAALLRELPGHAGRQGGEEFVLVFRCGVAEAAAVCERLRERIERHPWDGVAAGLRMTTSIGVTEIRAGESTTAALGRADTLLYAAKNEGRNRVRSSTSPSGNR
jgi:diguanylate cyclase (GGDEF)-like protein